MRETGQSMSRAALLLPAIVACGGEAKDLRSVWDAGCEAGSTEGEVAGATDGGACADWATTRPDYGSVRSRAEAECGYGAGSKSDSGSACQDRWGYGYEECYSDAYSSAYDLAWSDTGCP